MVPFEEFVDRVLRARRRLRVHARQVIERGGTAAIWARAWLNEYPPDDGLREILVAAYYSSQIFEEGQPTRVRLKWRHPAIGDGMVVQFDQPVAPTSPAVIAKLAQVTTDQSSLKLVTVGNSLHIAGIANDLLQNTTRAQWDAGWWQADVALVLDVKDPGHIEYHEPPLRKRYVRGQVYNLRPYVTIRQVREWVETLDADLNATLADKSDFGDSLERRSVAPFLSVVLQEIQRRRHGGMIIVIPSGQACPHIEIRYTAVRSSLRESVLSLWDDHSDVWKKISGLDLLVRDMIRRQNDETLYRNAVRLAQLSGVDGAIVLDDTFQLLGIGGVITLTTSSSGDQRNVVQSSGPHLELHGTRHLAAYRLCERVPGTIVFVVSQDGHLRVCISTESGVEVHDNLSV